MIHTYFVAYNYRRQGDATWDFANIEIACAQPMEVTEMRDAVTNEIASRLNAARPGSYTVVISNWVLLNSDFSPELQGINQQHFLASAQHNATKLTYFVAYNNNPTGSDLWHFGNATVTVDYDMELDFVRDYVAEMIEAHLASQFGGQHKVIISTWKVLRRDYPGDTRALPKM